MEHYDLCKKSDILQWVSDCQRVTVKYPHIKIKPIDDIKLYIRRKNYIDIWDLFDKDYVLWECKYSIFLSEKSKSTFDYYRSLSRKKLESKMKG